MKHLQETKTPVALKDLIIKSNESDWIFHQQSQSVALDSDIALSYEEQQVPKLSAPRWKSNDVTLSQLNTLAPNQANVTGILSLGIKEPKEVFTETAQEKTPVKEDSILEDKTGHITLHIRGTMINQHKPFH